MQFAHEYFQRGRPELLHKITRITKSQEPSISDIKSLKDEISSLHDDISHFTNQFDRKIQAVTAAVEADYQQRMKNIASSYQALSTLTMSKTNDHHQQTVAVSPISLSPVQDVSKIFADLAPTSSTTRTTMSIQLPKSGLLPEGNNDTNFITAGGSSVVSGSSCRSASGNSSGFGVTTESPTPSPPPPVMSSSALMTLSGVASAIMEHL